MTTFTSKDKARLGELIADMTFRGRGGTIPSGQPTGKEYTPWELINVVTGNASFERILTNLQKMLEAHKSVGVSRFNESNSKVRTINRLERQIELVEFAWGYFQWREENRLAKSEKDARVELLRKRIADKEEADMSVKDMKKELKALTNSSEEVEVEETASV